MKRMISLVLLLTLTLTLCACSPAPAEQTSVSESLSLSPSADAPAPSSAPPAVAPTEDYVEYKNDAGEVVLTSRITWEPVSASDIPELVRNTVNADVAQTAQNLRLAANDLHRQAVDDHAVNKQLPVYTDSREILLSHVCPKCISYTINGSTYVGGVHGLDTLRAMTYSSTTGARLTLDDLFDVDNSVYMPRLHAEIKKCIDAEKLSAAEGEFPYYDNYADILTANTFTDKWYLTDDALCLIYDTYEIGPYAAGIFTFTLPYSLIADILESSQVG